VGDFGDFGMKVATAELTVNMLVFSFSAHLSFVVMKLLPRSEDSLARITPELIAREGARPRFIFGDHDGCRAIGLVFDGCHFLFEVKGEERREKIGVCLR
jgi:hypothetical protein